MPKKENIKFAAYLQFLPDFKEERVQKFTTLVLTLVALSFFGIFAINPTISTIVKLQKELADNNFVDQKLQQKISNLTTLQQKYTALQNDMPFILAAIPKTTQIPLLAAQIQSVAKNSNTDIQNFQTFQVEVENPTSKKTYSSFSFSLSAEGNYDNLSNFLQNISSMQRIVSIDILSLIKKTGGGGLLLTLKGRAFFNQ